MNFWAPWTFWPMGTVEGPERTYGEQAMDHTTRKLSDLPPLTRWVGLLLTVTMLVAACGTSEYSTVNDSISDDDWDTSDQGEESESIESDMMSAESSDGSGSIDAAGDEAMSDADMMSEDAGDELNEDSASETAATGTDIPVADIGRKIIFTGNIEVEVDDVAQGTKDAIEAVDGVGGFVFGQNAVGGAEATAEITFKVAPERFDEALEALAGVGELRSQRVSADDVTERVVNLESRISVAELGVARLTEALAATTDLEDYAALEQQLLARESDLEVMRGELRTVQNRVDLATITVVLVQDRLVNDIGVQTSFYLGHDEGVGCPGETELSVQPGDDVTYCVEIINRGDQTLVDIEVTDALVGIESIDDMTTVFGSTTDGLIPGDSVMLALDINAERDYRTSLSVTATPTAGDDDGTTGRPVSVRASSTLFVDRSATPAGFSDGWRAGTELIGRLWHLILVTVGFLLPLLVLAPFAVAAVYLWRRLRRRRAASRRPKPVAAPPAPPAPSGTATPQPAPPDGEPTPPTAENDD